MSGFPNMPDIIELRDLLRLSDTEAESILSGRRQMATLQKEAEEAGNRRVIAERKIRELMDKMDCSEPGNTGYESRIRALLVGLSRLSELKT